MDQVFGDYRWQTYPNGPLPGGPRLVNLYREDDDKSWPGADQMNYQVAQVSYDDYDGEWYVDTLGYCIPLKIITDLVAEAKAMIKIPSGPGRESGS